MKLKISSFFGANQFANTVAVLMLRARHTMTPIKLKSDEGSLPISLFCTATKILLAFIAYHMTKVSH